VRGRLWMRAVSVLDGDTREDSGLEKLLA
jgi:hypothetical protein